jgi:hypothetical protein
MRAKTINFERGLNPKAAMEVGGIALGKELWDKKEEFKKMWKDYIINLFKGKTVTGSMQKYVTETDDKGNMWPHPKGHGNYTVKAEQVIVSDQTIRGDNAEREGLPANIILTDGKGLEFYVLEVSDAKIYIN